MTDTLPGLGHNSAAVGEMIDENPALVFSEAGILDELLAAIEKEIKEHKPDLKTEEGRKEIWRLAYGISRQKTAIDDAGKALNEERRKENAKVNEKRRKVCELLDALRDKARAPLDKWQAEQDAKADHIEAVQRSLEEARNTPQQTSSEGFQHAIENVKAITIDEDAFGELTGDMQGIKDSVIADLESGKAHALRVEADRKELEELRAKAEADAIAKAKADAAAAAAAAEAERIKKANEQARIDAEAKVKAEADAAQAAADAEAQRKIDEAEAATKAAQAEADRLAREAQEKAEAEQARIDAQIARDEDAANRESVKNKAVSALIAAGIKQDAANQVILLIAAGDVPAVSINY